MRLYSVCRAVLFEPLLNLIDFFLFYFYKYEINVW